MSIYALNFVHAVTGSAETRQQRVLVIVLVAAALWTWGVLVPCAILGAHG
jgi:hypothetical protein